MATSRKPKYATWIRARKLIAFWLVTLAIAGVAALGGLVSPYFWLVGLLALPFLWLAIIFSLAAYQFSPWGGKVQNTLHDLLISSLATNGRVLDIGCGSGHLILRLAKKNPSDHDGIDYWGSDWEYSRDQCVRNAEAEGVTNVRFTQGSASNLPFASESIENIVSCVTFHEVSDVDDKTRAVVEALRVLKPHGRFALLDLFTDSRYFGGLENVKNAIERSGGSIETVTEFQKNRALPFPINTSPLLKHAVLLVGTKRG